MNNNNLTILAIETSCDDTCIAVLKIKNSNLEILSNTISSQTKLHTKYGGIFPTLAKREHQKNLPIIFKKALKKSGNPKIDLIAVTIGPGLEPCLWTGINFAKELSQKLKVPIIPINHIEAHIAANFISENSKLKIKNSKLFPAVCLVVSGGHTQLILMKNFGKYKIIGETRDDAAGECFDKTARILGLGYPGGPVIAELAQQWKSQIRKSQRREASQINVKHSSSTNNKFQTNSKFQILNSQPRLAVETKRTKFKINLPRPMIHQKNYDFSFSGLKTAVLYKIKDLKLKTKSEKFIQEISFEIQQAIIDVLIYKTLKAAKDYKAKTIILGGGVSANQELRKQFKLKIENYLPNPTYIGRNETNKLKINFLVPEKKLCLDNAVMIGIAAYLNFLRNKIKSVKKIKAKANLGI